MKQITITTDKCTLLVIELPKYTNLYRRISGGGYIINKKNMNPKPMWESPEGYKSIGYYQNITEWQANNIIDETDNPFWYGQGFKYIDYGKDDNCFQTALESIDSLLQANGIWFENPLGEMPHKKDFYQGQVYMLGDHATASNRWKEAQSKVWDKKRTYLFKKP